MKIFGLFRSMPVTNIMMRTFRVTSLLLLILSAFALSSCSDFSGPLPGGYRVVRTNINTVVIVAPEGVPPKDRKSGQTVIAAKIDKMNVSGNLVYGFVRTSPHSEVRHLETPGYFIIDTSTHQVQTGLEEDSFLLLLRDVNVPNELVDPRKFAS